MNTTGIEWSDLSWNPVTGCTKVSPGCAHCYAEAITLRFKRGPAFLPGKSEIQLHPERLEQPLKIKKPSRIFVNSMSDLFHEDVPDNFIADIFCIMERAYQHKFQILTKRPERMLDWVRAWTWSRIPNYQRRGMRYVRENIWLGVSIENQYWADRRVPKLLATPTNGVRFLSVEPLLKPVDLSEWLPQRVPCEGYCSCDSYFMVADGERCVGAENTLDWVIVGGESGAKARSMHPDWVRSIRDQCVAAGVPFFFKQWGGARPGGDALLDGREWREFPETSRLVTA